ncbi:MAG: ATP-binding protein [Pseudomonadota bacterium]
MHEPDSTTAEQTERDRQFEAFRAGDANSKDLVVRCLVVAAVGVALWFATDQFVMLVWGFGYTVINLVYAGFLRRQVLPVSQTSLLITALLSVIMASWYTAMVIYIVTLPDPYYLILAAIGVVGAGMHCLLANREWSYSTYIDVVATVVPAVAVAAIAANDIPTPSIRVATALGGVFVAGYFWHCLKEIIAEREVFEASIKSDLQDQKMRALGQLTSGVAHDFNNLLAIVLANIELSKTDSDQHRIEKYLNDAETAAQSGATLIRQLMAYVRKSRLEVTDVSLRALFSRLSSVLSRVLPPQIELKVAIGDEDRHIRGDATLLETAILNLVINARDAIGDVVGRITVSAEESADAGFVVIRVSDTGPGMDAETIERASEPFYTTKRSGEGSGLGLSMVKGFAEQSGGQLMLQNGQTGGLVASLSLPHTA